MIKIKIRFFAAFREITGKSQILLEMPEGSLLKDAISEIVNLYPEVAEIVRISRFAINMEYGDAATKLASEDEVTVIMPVSGGLPSRIENEIHVEITENPINPDIVLNFVSDPAAGSLLLFNGVVRNNEDGKPVQKLFYEAYKEMALKELEKLILTAFEKFDLIKVSIIHRVGILEIGEISVSIGVSSAHREDSYLASRFLIEGIKENVPIWKKESFVSSSKWKRI